jgi:hypothetical protein
MSKHNHKPGQTCDACAFGIESVLAREKEAMEKVGWYAHIIVDDPNTPYHMNYHTHGLQESFEHKDLQVCFPIDPNLIHECVTTLIDKIRTGKTYKANDISFDLMKTRAITFIDAKENDREVLRVVFSDEAGRFKEDEIDDFLKQQYQL